MRWKGRRESDNIEDRRGVSPKGLAIGGGGIGVLIIALIVFAMGGDPTPLIKNAGSVGGGQTTEQRPYKGTPEEEEMKRFVSVILAETEDVWNAQFAKMGKRYVEPKLVVFKGQVESACGVAGASVGPFYCSPDQNVYLDLAFFQELDNRFGAPGEFARAYVIAHEVGHHVQNLLGITNRVHSQRNQLSEREYNRLSVRLELQADFLAGLWAHYASHAANITRSDIEDALRAANAIGDDTLQRQTQGEVMPDSFTHGTSAQRMRWFLKGWESGDIRQGDTFSASRL